MGWSLVTTGTSTERMAVAAESGAGWPRGTGTAAWKRQ